MITCAACQREIPEGNYLLHQMRCQGSQRAPTADPSRSGAETAARPSSSQNDAACLAATDTSTSGELVRCRVSSSVEDLQVIHEIYGWPPGTIHVRPAPAVRAQKELLLSNMESMWNSHADWVFHHVFGTEATRGADGRRVSTRPEPGCKVFAPNPFPYELPEGTQHWVLWLASPESQWPDETVTAEIAKQVDERGGGQFVWYPNPKMSLSDPELHHVQVFWRPP